MYFDNKNNAECCGCTACKSVCPKATISMKKDERGFLYPVINEDSCIDCSLCRKVCRFHRSEPWGNSVIAAYGMHHKNIIVKRTSRSGGAFYMFAEEILALGGSVYGAAFDSYLEVVHTKVVKLSELHKLQGSKYVQSKLGSSYAAVFNDLKKEEYVLFSGTACQVAGLLSFLEKKSCNTSKLITCDIVCQGVSSPELYSDYRKYLENKYGSKLKKFNFRDASRIGWEGHEESFQFVGNKKIYYSREYTNYYYYYLRPSCFECKYAGLHRPADFSLADFWGVKENYPDFADKNGNSLILVNTEKGKQFFEVAKKTGDTIEVVIYKCLQPRLKSPSAKPEGYESFWNEYKMNGYHFCIKKYGKESMKSKLVYTIKPIIRKFIKRI